MEKIKCNECGKELQANVKVCPNCGYENKIKKSNSKKIKFILVIIMGAIIVVALSSHIYQTNLDNRYNEALSLFENNEYEKAKEKFEKVDNYKISNLYIKYIDAYNLIEDDKFQEGLDILNSINNEEINKNALEEYANIAIKFKNKEYKEIVNGNKYTTKFYNDKEKEYIQESFYIVGTQYLNDGYMGSAKEILMKIKGYKDTDKLLENKYFNLIGNHYLYSVSAGYKIGMMSLLFYSYGDELNYNVFTHSIFDTNIPDGYNFKYRIKDNKIIMGNDSIIMDIISFDGHKLVVRTSSHKYTLVKQ